MSAISRRQALTTLGAAALCAPTIARAGYSRPLSISIDGERKGMFAGIFYDTMTLFHESGIKDAGVSDYSLIYRHSKSSAYERLKAGDIDMIVITNFSAPEWDPALAYFSATLSCGSGAKARAWAKSPEAHDLLQEVGARQGLRLAMGSAFQDAPFLWSKTEPASIKDFARRPVVATGSRLNLLFGQRAFVTPENDTPAVDLAKQIKAVAVDAGGAHAAQKNTASQEFPIALSDPRLGMGDTPIFAFSPKLSDAHVAQLADFFRVILLSQRKRMNEKSASIIKNTPRSFPNLATLQPYFIPSVQDAWAALVEQESSADPILARVFQSQSNMS